MVNIDPVLPSDTEVRLVAGMDGDVAISRIDVENGDFSTGGGSSG